MNSKLEEHFCIYLDILGYSNRIENIEGDELNSELDNFAKYVVTENDFLEQLSKIIQFNINVFSDNILISLPVTRETINAFHLVLNHILDYQKSLIQSDYFIRGGISKGMLYVDEKIIWGKALIEAVKLEKDAVYPFISISDDIINLFRKNDLLSDINEFLSVPVIEINDGKHFLDYLQTTIYIHDRKPVTYYTFLQFHQNLVKYNLEKNTGRIFEKYNMLAKYHNEFCNYYKEQLPQIQYYKIKNTLSDNTNFKRRFLKVPIKTA